MNTYTFYMKDCAGNSDHINTYEAESEMEARQLALRSDDDRRPTKLMKINGVDVVQPKIEQLAEQAGLISTQMNGFDRFMLNPAEKRFANLIIDACLEEVDNVENMLVDDPERIGAMWVGLGIAKRFGRE